MNSGKFLVRFSALIIACGQVPAARWILHLQQKPLLSKTGEQNLRLDRYCTDRLCVHSWVCCAKSCNTHHINICKDDLYYRMFQDVPVLSEDATKVYVFRPHNVMGSAQMAVMNSTAVSSDLLVFLLYLSFIA